MYCTITQNQKKPTYNLPLSFYSGGGPEGTAHSHQITHSHTKSHIITQQEDQLLKHMNESSDQGTPTKVHTKPRIQKSQIGNRPFIQKSEGNEDLREKRSS